MKRNANQRLSLRIAAAVLLLVILSAKNAMANNVAPLGYTAMCEEMSTLPECGGPVEASVKTPSFSDLRTVNAEVNVTITYTDDQEIWGKPEYWTPNITNKGNCKHYALVKLHRLLAKGWDIKNLKLAAGKYDGEWHIVLVVDFENHSYVLDSAATKMVTIEATQVEMKRIQSIGGSQDWVIIK